MFFTENKLFQRKGQGVGVWVYPHMFEVSNMNFLQYVFWDRKSWKHKMFETENVWNRKCLKQKMFETENVYRDPAESCMMLFKRMGQGVGGFGQVNVLRYNEAAFINASVNPLTCKKHKMFEAENVRSMRCLEEMNCFEHKMSACSNVMRSHKRRQKPFSHRRGQFSTGHKAICTP